jgi:hypothetical protein
MIQRDLVWLKHTKYLVFGEDGLMSLQNFTAVFIIMKILQFEGVQK